MHHKSYCIQTLKDSPQTKDYEKEHIKSEMPKMSCSSTNFSRK